MERRLGMVGMVKRIVIELLFRNGFKRLLHPNLKANDLPMK